MTCQVCPTCLAPVGQPCRGIKTRKTPLAEVHAARNKQEYGAWALVYDRKWRELPEGQRFCCDPYKVRGQHEASGVGGGGGGAGREARGGCGFAGEGIVIAHPPTWRGGMVEKGRGGRSWGWEALGPYRLETHRYREDTSRQIVAAGCSGREVR